MESIFIKAFAKINLELDVLDKRPDGYHNIDSIFQAIDIFDTIQITRIDKGYSLTGSLTCSIENDIVTKMKVALEKHIGKELPCNIHIIKGLPISSGMGGGSSDAAATIIGLNELFALGLDTGVMMSIGKSVGADVPFFISGIATAHVTGIGEIIEKSDINPSKYYVIARPHKRMDTRKMFELFDKTGKNFTEIASDLCPDVNKLMTFFSFASTDCKMSGSGPVVFAGFDTYEEARNALYGYGFDNLNGDWFICRSSENTYEIIKKK